MELYLQSQYTFKVCTSLSSFKIYRPITSLGFLLFYAKNFSANLDNWLTVHRSISLVSFQLDAQNSYLFIYNTFFKILYMFRALPCSSPGLRRNCIHAASGIVTFCRLLSCAPVKKNFLNRSTGQSPAESDDTRDCIYKITK